MATRFYSILAFSLILPIAGCNSATQPNAASRPAQTTTVASSTTGRASSQESSSEEGVNPKDSNSSLSKGSEAATTTTNTATTTPTTTTATATAATVETAATQAKQAAEPSNEQLAAWKQTPYEPLQLLAVRESPKIGLSTSIVGLPDGRRFLLAGNKVSLWAIDGIEPEHVFLDLSYSDKNPIILSMALSPDGKWFAAGDSEGLIHVWDIAERNELISKKIYPTGIVQVAVSPDSSEIATITYSDEVTIWSSDKLEQKKRFKVDTNGVKRIMVINSDSIAVAGETTSSWSVASGKLIQKLSSGRYNFTLARLRDKNRILVGDKTGLQIWNVQDQKVEDTIAGDFATNELVDFSPDGTLLATANGSSIRLWDMASKQVVQIIDTYGWPIVGIHWLPETNLLLVASENGCVRFWGTAKSGETLSMRPLHAAMALPDQTSRVPANPIQLAQSIDLRTFPKLPGALTSMSDLTTLNVTTSAKQEDAKTFYRYFLGERGWTEKPDDASAPGALHFRKNGFMLTASFYEAGDSQTSIYVNHSGNYDLRWAPLFDKAPIESVIANENVVMVKTKADIIQIETALLAKMQAVGWTPYSRLNASHREEADSRNLEFLQNGMTLRVSISRMPAEPSSFIIQYSGSPALRSIPIPKDSSYVEFDGSTQPMLVATTAMSLTETRDFYDKELIHQGWIARELGRILKEDRNWLTYIQGQTDLTIGLDVLPSGRTRIKVGKGLENSSWQLAKPIAESEAKATKTGMEAADFPILNSLKSAKYDSTEKSIEFATDGPLALIAEKYTTELKPLGWVAQSGGVRSEEYTLVTFAKEKTEISLRARMADGKGTVNIQGDGLLWNKSLPGGKQVISYEAWMRENKLPASLEWLSKYESEMRAIVPKAE